MWNFCFIAQALQEKLQTWRRRRLAQRRAGGPRVASGDVRGVGPMEGQVPAAGAGGAEGKNAGEAIGVFSELLLFYQSRNFASSTPKRREKYE